MHASGKRKISERLIDGGMDGWKDGYLDRQTDRQILIYKEKEKDKYSSYLT